VHVADRALISKEPAVTMQECVDANASISCQTGKYSLSDREDLGYKL